MIARAWRDTFRWPLPVRAVWLLFPSLVATLALAAKPAPPHDYWWHLVLGREIDHSGAIPRTNLFLYTLPVDTPFHDLPWLGQWLMYRLYAGAGHHGNAWALSLAVIAAWLIVLDAALRRSEHVRVVAAIAALAALLATPLYVARTQMFAFPLYAALLAACFGVADGRLSKRWLLVVPLLTALWANLHGSFVLAPLIAASFAVGLALDPHRRVEVRWWLAATIAAGLCGLASPIGLGNYVYVLNHLGVRNVTEWQAPDPRTSEGAVVWITLAASAIVVVVRRRRLAGYEIAPLLLTTVMVASATRSLFWWVTLLPLVLPRALASAEPRPNPGVPALNAVLVLAIGVLIAALQPGLLLESVRLRTLPQVRPSGEGAGLLTRAHPIELVRRLDASDRVFHEQRIGALIELEKSQAGHPRQVAFVDQRMEIIPDSVWQEYFAISRAEDWERRLAAWDVTALLIDEHTQAALARAASSSEDWERVAQQGDFLLLRKRDDRR